MSTSETEMAEAGAAEAGAAETGAQEMNATQAGAAANATGDAKKVDAGQALAEVSGAASRPRPLGSTVTALMRKELLVELRTLESVPGMALFAVSTFVVFHFALKATELRGDLAAGVLWVTLLFAAMLGVNRLFVADSEQGGFDGFLLAPVDRSAMLIAKAGSLLIYLIALEIVAVPAFSLLLLGPPIWPGLPWLLLCLLLADFGLASIGTFVAALAVKTRSRDLIGPLVALPLLVPIAIGASAIASPLLSGGGHGSPPARWLLLLGLYDLVFGLIAYAVFDFLLED